MAARPAGSLTEKEILGEFQARRGRLQEVARKVEELQSEVAEHEMVIKALQPMDAGRKCFRLVGDVLVERTVGETLPAVIKNKDNLDVAIKTLTETYNALEKSITEFQNKHQIKIVDRQGKPIEDVPQQASQGSNSKGGQGVLVK